MQGREKVLAIEPSVCYTLFDAKYERKELLKCTFLHNNKMNKFRTGINRIPAQQLSL